MSVWVKHLRVEESHGFIEASQELNLNSFSKKKNPRLTIKISFQRFLVTLLHIVHWTEVVQFLSLLVKPTAEMCPTVFYCPDTWLTRRAPISSRLTLVLTQRLLQFRVSTDPYVRMAIEAEEGQWNKKDVHWELLCRNEPQDTKTSFMT